MRVSKYKTQFARGYTPSWTTELFKSVRIRRTVPPVYYVQDQNGVEVSGAFYAEELQKTALPNTYLVEKVLKRRGDRVYVRWLGMSSKYDSWI